MARILIVDDEAGLRDFLSEVLQDEGHATETAASGEEAMRALRRRAFELLITDMKMSGMSGIDLLREAKTEQPELEVVVVTAHGSVDTAVEAMKLGAIDFLQKPLSGPEELRLVAARALERRSLLNLRETARRESSHVPPLSHGDEAMEEVVGALEKVAATQATVLLVGESGTGKELAARSVHEWSDRAEGPFVAVNCAAISDTLIESELFGHEKGAFTGATESRRGRIELAAGGTFFLDEVGELKPELQAKLLRVLQERSFERVGGSRTFEGDVRWVAATNRDLEDLIAEGGFREDLYHRLAVFPVRLPPLRERRGDIAPLAEVLLRSIEVEIGHPGLSLADDAKELIRKGEWSGNVRELSNVLEQAAILASSTRLSAADLSLRSRAAKPQGDSMEVTTLEDMERRAIEAALRAEDGNRKQAAERLGIGLRTLYDKLKRYDLS